MQRAIFQHTTVTGIQSQATRVLPGHGTDFEEQAVNDENYHDESSLMRMVFSVLANVVVGALLLTGMFVLPHLIAEILS